jgi:large subunit ribosomal protein L6
MSRIGKIAVPVPSGVTVTLDGQAVVAKGPKGELSTVLVDDVLVSMDEGSVRLKPRSDSKKSLSMWGMSRTIVANLVQGVSEGYTKKLEINGVGYRAAMQGSKLQLIIGLSHDVLYDVPSGIQVEVPKPTEIVITGIDKQKVGQVAAEIRSYRKPEPFKGKGIKYENEYIFRKEGKKK